MQKPFTTGGAKEYVSSQAFWAFWELHSKISPLHLPTPVLLLLVAVLMLGVNACQFMTITMSQLSILLQIDRNKWKRQQLSVCTIFPISHTWESSSRHQAESREWQWRPEQRGKSKGRGRAIPPSRHSTGLSKSQCSPKRKQIGKNKVTVSCSCSLTQVLCSCAVPQLPYSDLCSLVVPPTDESCPRWSWVSAEPPWVISAIRNKKKNP